MSARGHPYLMPLPFLDLDRAVQESVRRACVLIGLMAHASLASRFNAVASAVFARNGKMPKPIVSDVEAAAEVRLHSIRMTTKGAMSSSA